MKKHDFGSKIISTCQICGGDDLRPVVELGTIPPVNAMPSIDTQLAAEFSYPLDLVRCTSCSLVQITCEVSGEILFPTTYPYLSGSTKILARNFEDLAKESCETLGLDSASLVMDIGSNDGTLLSKFKDAGVRVLGIEPTDAYKVAVKNGIDSVNEFFSEQLAGKLVKEFGRPKLVTAANVFAHIADVNSIVRGIKALIGDDGVFVSESHYLGSIIDELQYDTIYHEHLRYYSLASISHLLSAHGLKVFKAVHIPSHGGSIRVYASASDAFDLDQSVTDILTEERKLGLIDGRRDAEFKNRVIRSKHQLLKMLSSIKIEGKDIVGIGAPSRASTLMNFTGIDETFLDAVMEISSSKKIGKLMPGTRVPVIDEAYLYEHQPEFALLLSWHIADELCAIIRRNGYNGKFIVPLPTPKILN